MRKLADKTFGVKVTDELYEKVKMMIESSGVSAKEWFEKAVSLTEMNAIKQGATDYSQDLSELEVHTTRIYELVSNMVQRSIYIKDHAIKEYADKLEQKESIINEYLNKTNAAIEEAKIAKEAAGRLNEEKKELFKQLEDLRSTNLNNQLLIDEYKEKNDTLNGLVSKYQSFADENEKLKEQFANEREILQTKVKEISSQNDELQNNINGLKQQIESLKEHHNMELERLTEKMDYEKSKAVIETERNYQEKLLNANNEYNEKMKELYSEISLLRREYEEKIKNLELELKERKNNN